MRDPKRISKVLNSIKSQWEKFPDMRLGQLIMNAVNNPTMLYYIEDDKLIECINALYNQFDVKGDDNNGESNDH